MRFMGIVAASTLVWDRFVVGEFVATSNGFLEHRRLRLSLSQLLSQKCGIHHLSTRS